MCVQRIPWGRQVKGIVTALLQAAACISGLILGEPSLDTINAHFGMTSYRCRYACASLWALNVFASPSESVPRLCGPSQEWNWVAHFTSCQLVESRSHVDGVELAQRPSVVDPDSGGSYGNYGSIVSHRLVHQENCTHKGTLPSQGRQLVPLPRVNERQRRSSHDQFGLPQKSKISSADFKPASCLQCGRSDAQFRQIWSLEAMKECDLFCCWKTQGSASFHFLLQYAATFCPCR